MTAVEFSHPQFRNLSETEWSSVWSHVKAASGEGPLPDEAHIRKLVDDSALLSGYFFNYGEIELYRQQQNFPESQDSHYKTQQRDHGAQTLGNSLG